LDVSKHMYPYVFVCVEFKYVIFLNFKPLCVTHILKKRGPSPPSHVVLERDVEMSVP